MTPQFYPWLFDSREAWSHSLNDPRYSYDLPLSHFMTLYQEYRTGQPAPPPRATAYSSSAAPFPLNSGAKVAPAPQPEKSSGAGQILGQDEIDALLMQMHH